MPPQATDFSEADFAPTFTDADFQEPLPKVTINPYEAQRQSTPMGPFGPLHPEEVLALPQVLKAPAAAIEQTGIPDAMSEVAADLRRRLGIDPSAQAGVPAFNIKSLPIATIPGTNIRPLDFLSKGLGQGVEEGAGQLASGLTAPGMAEALPFGAARPVAAGFGIQALSAVPGDVEALLQAKTPQEAGQAGIAGAANLGIGVSIAGHLLPRTMRLAEETLKEKGPTDAPQERIQPEGVQAERAGNGPSGTPPEASPSGGVPPAARVAKEAQIPLIELTKEEQDYLDNAQSDLDVPVEVVNEPLKENEPFAGQIATIDRQNGRILINPSEYTQWLQTVPKERRAQAVKSLVDEERLHLAVDDESAAGYWNALTSLEKAINRRRYTGKWGGIGIDDTMMGHEALRFRLQQLSRMTPREIAEAANKERWTVQTITALESTVRKVRETMGTEASATQKAILNRIQRNLNTAKAAAGAQPGAYRKRFEKELIEQRLEEARKNLKAAATEQERKTYQDEITDLQQQLGPAGEEEAFPGAIRKNRETSEQGFMYLPPVPKSETLERHGFPQPTAVAIENAAAEHFDHTIKAGEAPSFEQFSNELKGQYGSGIKRDALWYTWQDAMMKRLSNAPGAELDKLIESLGLRGKLQSEHQGGFGKGQIPDPIDIPKAHQAQFEEMARMFPHKKVITPRIVRQWFGPALRRRYAAMGEIINKLSEEAGPKPEKPWNRSEVGPEEITQIAGQRQFRPVTPEEAANPAVLGELATQGAAVDATGKGAPPRTVSKNLMALRDKSGRVLLVSVWKDPRSGPRVTNPGAPNLPSRRIDASLLKDYTPLSIMSMREPLQDFRQTFESQEAFAKWFGDAGIEGTPGIKTSSFTGPEAGMIEAQAGIRPGGTPKPEPGLTFTEKDFESPTATELTAPQRGPIQTGRALYRSPRGEPESQLSVNQRLEVERQARENYPYEPTRFSPSEALAQRGINIMPGARGERTPAAFNKLRQQAKDSFEVAAKDVENILLRRGTKRDIPALMDAADDSAAAMAVHAKNAIKVSSTVPLDPDLKGMEAIRKFRENKAQAKTTREAGIAYVVSGGDRSRIDQSQRAKGARPRLPSYKEYLDRAQARAEQWQTDINPLKRLEAKKDMAYIDKLRGLLDYAKDNWSNTEFVAGAEQFKLAMKNQIEFENANGFDTQAREDYVPARYEGDFWNDNLLRFTGKRLLGTEYRMPKKFTDPFEAIAAGPYRMANLDLADLAEHRINQGARRVEHEIWFRALRGMNDQATGKQVAQNPVPYKTTDPETGEERVKYKSPSPEYTMIYPTANARPLAILNPYVDVVKSVVMPSALDRIELGNFPLGKTAVAANQLLKHGAILLWDTFHPGRLFQYAAAIAGFKGAGWKGGFSALTYAPQNLAEAVRKGYVSKEAAAWASEPVRLGPHMVLTRQQILEQLRSRGLNVNRVSDALYKTAIEQIPLLGKTYHSIISPYNELLFSRFIPGLIAEQAIGRVEALRARYPNVPFSKLLKDVSTDMNVFFGNMGRQGIFRSRTMQQIGQIFLLAPAWQEGLFQKEARFAARLAGGAARAVGADLPYRRGLPALGALGEGMARGLATYFAMTQIANLISRGHLTFQNPEKGHKLDAWIPVPWGKGGFWLSPLSTFAEVTHDIIRMVESKPRVYEAINQLGDNRLSPVAKMALILKTGKSPAGDIYSTTPRYLAGALSQITPFKGAAPIAFSAPARFVANKLFPNQVSPNPPGGLARQLVASTLGTKVEVDKTPVQRMQQVARDFVQDNKLQKDTGWEQVRTDEPSYSRLRSALANDDKAEARKQLKEIRRQHTDGQIEQAMKIWARRPWTGSHQNEALMRSSMSPEELDLYSQANEARMEMLQKFYDLLLAE